MVDVGLSEGTCPECNTHASKGFLMAVYKGDEGWIECVAPTEEGDSCGAVTCFECFWNEDTQFDFGSPDPCCICGKYGMEKWYL